MLSCLKVLNYKNKMWKWGVSTLSETEFLNLQHETT